ALAFEEIQIPRPRTGEDVGDAVAVEVHQLWSEADASARRHFAAILAVEEPGELVEFGLGVGDHVAVDAQPRVAKLADEQILDAASVDVGEERSGVTNYDVDRLTAGQDLDRRSQLLAALRFRWRQGQNRTENDARCHGKQPPGEKGRTHVRTE